MWAYMGDYIHGPSGLSLIFHVLTSTVVLYTYGMMLIPIFMAPVNCAIIDLDNGSSTVRYQSFT